MSSHQITDGFQGKWFFWALLLLGLLTGGCGGPGSPTSPSINVDPSEVEFQLLHLTNGERSSADVDPDLTPDTILGEIARSHSYAMRDQGFIGHESVDGKTLRQRLEEAGIDFSRAAENLAQVTNTSNPASFAHGLLMDSERHRTNILDPRFSYVGIGVSRSDNTFWITQIFIKP